MADKNFQTRYGAINMYSKRWSASRTAAGNYKKRQTIDTEIDEFAFRCKHEFVYLYDVGRLFVHGEHPR